MLGWPGVSPGGACHASRCRCFVDVCSTGFAAVEAELSIQVATLELEVADAVGRRAATKASRPPSRLTGSLRLRLAPPIADSSAVHGMTFDLVLRQDALFLLCDIAA
jgi:hypothetical protein